MKRIALSVAFGIALVASSTIASANSSAGSSSGGLTGWLLCSLGATSYCGVTPDTNTNPVIINK